MRIPVTVLAFACVALPADWPAWRGAGGMGKTDGANPVRQWSRTENVAWRTPLPERGNSTPIVHGNRVFLTQAITKPGRRTLMCFDRQSGRQLWQSGVNWDAPEPTHATNPYASASPVTDGERVIAWFGSAGIAAYDFDGKQLWHRDLGEQRHTWGYGSSPTLHGDSVFLHFGPGPRSFLIALDKRTGRTLWQHDFAAGKGAAYSNWNAEDMYGSWSSPVVIRNEGREELILPAPRELMAFDPSSGRVIWTSAGLGDLVYPSAVFGGGILYASSGFQGPAFAIRPGANKPLWSLPKSKNAIGSGIIHDGHLYTVDTGGIAQCQDVETGKVVWTGRLAGKGESNNVWSSPVLVGGLIYVMNQGGDAFVFRAMPQAFEIIGQSAVGETTNASLVVAGADIFLRTHEALWKISAQK